MSKNIQIIDRATGEITVEKVYGKKALAFLYSDTFFSKIFLVLLSKLPFFSRFYGFLQKRKFSKKKILPFIRQYDVKAEEFEKKIEEYKSFNDFFIRKLKKKARHIAEGEDVAVLPADGRYMVFQNINLSDGFYVKGAKFDLYSFLQDKSLAAKYHKGSMVIARLCPTDYHRFHFPFDCFAAQPRRINGYLYSVNPLAVRKNINIFSENKRVITLLETDNFADVLYIEVGATNVGSICMSFIPNTRNKKGEEKGYFALGGSSIVLLFEENKIKFDKDLIINSEKRIETKANFGQSLGISQDGLI